MTTPSHVVVMHRFGVSAERVFDACLDPAWVGQWMFGPTTSQDQRTVHMINTPRIGGSFSFVSESQGTTLRHHGAYLEIDRPALLAFTWAAGDAPSAASRVTIEFTSRENACDVKLTHVMGANWSAFIDHAAHVWTRMLDELERLIRQDSLS